MRHAVIALVLPLSLLAACVAPTDTNDTASESEELTKTTYVSIDEYWTTPAQQDAWFALGRTLEAGFDDVCGDTFCEGDYANLTSLDFTCSVSKARGAVKECAWTFVGSYEQVTARTGVVSSEAPYFVCKIKPSGTATELVTMLSSAGKEAPLRRIIPGTNGSLYDALAACFQHPKGTTTLPKIGTGPFVNATEAQGSAQQLTLSDANDALKAAFDDVCGDTFCEGDYTNLASLRFACSANDATGVLGSCLWVFGGSYAEVAASSGTITAHAKTFRCNIPVEGTAANLAAVLTAPGPVDAIHRPLPGGTASAYDAIGTCL